MAYYDFLPRVKSDLGLTGNDHFDDTLQGYIEEVQAYLEAAGVPRAVSGHPVSAGVISRGVSDLWNYGSGNATLSPYFFQRAAQLALTKEADLADG